MKPFSDGGVGERGRRFRRQLVALCGQHGQGARSTAQAGVILEGQKKGFDDPGAHSRSDPKLNAFGGKQPATAFCNKRVKANQLLVVGCARGKEFLTRFDGIVKLYASEHLRIDQKDNYLS